MDFDFDAVLGKALDADKALHDREKRLRKAARYGQVQEPDLVFLHHSDGWMHVLKNRFGSTGMTSPDRFAVFYRMAQRPLEVTRENADAVLPELEFLLYGL